MPDKFKKRIKKRGRITAYELEKNLTIRPLEMVDYNTYEFENGKLYLVSVVRFKKDSTISQTIFYYALHNRLVELGSGIFKMNDVDIIEEDVKDQVAEIFKGMFMRLMGIEQKDSVGNEKHDEIYR